MEKETPKQKSSSGIDPLLNEWKRGMLTFWALGLVVIQPRYGLEIRKEIESSSQGSIRMGVSTIYQIMRRLERRGLVESRWERTTLGPPRAIYSATQSGRDVIQCYLLEVFSPQSPIPSALGSLIGQMTTVLSGDLK